MCTSGYSFPCASFHTINTELIQCLVSQFCYIPLHIFTVSFAFCHPGEFGAMCKSSHLTINSSFPFPIIYKCIKQHRYQHRPLTDSTVYPSPLWELNTYTYSVFCPLVSYWSTSGPWLLYHNSLISLNTLLRDFVKCFLKVQVRSVNRIPLILIACWCPRRARVD